MLHLPADRLAALADAVPTAEERAHLETCGECARELETYRALLDRAASARARTALPLTRWETLAPRLRSEGLLGAPAPASRGWAPRWLGRAAAAALLVATGVAAGRWSAGAPPIPLDDRGAEMATAGDSAPATSAAPVTFTSREEALAELENAERTYQRASAWLIARDSAARAMSEDDYRLRLATLDEVAAATRAALDEAPYDPVLSRYYLATIGAREATLRQLDNALPVGVTLTGF